MKTTRLGAEWAASLYMRVAHRTETDHCIETLRLNIMCQSDVGVFTMNLFPGSGLDGVWPDFSTLHTCRNYEAIREWAVEHTVTYEDEGL